MTRGATPPRRNARRRPRTPSVRAALVYDFDGTLARGNIQEHTLLPELKEEKGRFWVRVKKEAKRHDADEILTYMRLMVELSRQRRVPITRALLRKHGRETQLFDGVLEWFGRINTYGTRQNLALEHYVISSGISEMIEGCPASRHFVRVFGSTFFYNSAGHATWPAIAINYTTKTQYLFRINKGVLNNWDNDGVNRWVPMEDRPLPFSRIIFIGDGDTDIPSMKMIHHQGGQAIAVFDPSRGSAARSQEKIYRLITEDRVRYVAPADYTEGSQLDVIVKGILGRIARDNGYRGRS